MTLHLIIIGLLAITIITLLLITHKKIGTLLLENGKLGATATSLREVYTKLNQEHLELKNSHKTTEKNLYEVKQELELKIQAMKEFEKRVGDWESSRGEAITQAKAAIFETASKLGEQLIDKHKTETKEAEKKVSETTKNLQTQFEDIVKNVAVLNNEIKSSKDTVEHVRNALLSPAGAGSLAEITLENILKASGLQPERDFLMQYSFGISGSIQRLRPDAIVFLPGNNLLIIDSKASKYFTEMVSNKDDKDVSSQLKNTMNNHIKNLASKDYKEFLLEHFKDREISHVSSIMFLPSEAAVEKLSQLDKNFVQKAWEKDIFPVGPTGLINVLTYAKFQIAATKQSENQKIILDEVRKLLTSLMTLYDHAKKVGQNIYSACNNFDKFAGSFNANLLPKAKNLEKLGINVQKNKSLPSSLDRLTVISSNKVDMIEIEEVIEKEIEEM